MHKLSKLAFAFLFALPPVAMAMPESHAIEAPPVQQQWRMPLDKVRVSSFFGALRGRRAHAGIDFSVPSGTPVTATDGGIVVASADQYRGDRKYGNVVVIEHDNGLRSLYAHLNQRDVMVGDVVSGGERIGLSGSTGHSTGPHLHLEAWRDKFRIDPRALLLANLNDYALPSAMRAAHVGAGAKGKKQVHVRSRKKAALAAKSSKHRKRA